MTLIHHVELFTKRCLVRASLNGVPFAEVSATDPHTDHFAPPVNPFLIGEGNVLEIEVGPALDGDALTEWTEAEVEIAVRALPKGGILAPGAGGQLVFEANLVPELAERIAQAQEEDVELEAPQSFLHVFDSEGESFADELVEAEPFDDEGALLRYALHLRDLFRDGNVAGFMAEVEPKCHVWARAYQEPVDRFRSDIEDGLQTEFLPAGVMADFDEAEVALRPLAGGRLWALERTGRRALIQTTPDANDQYMQFPIVAALRDGQLRVVR